MKINKHLTAVVALGSAVLLMAGCASNPLTGTKEIDNYNDLPSAKLLEPIVGDLMSMSGEDMLKQAIAAEEKIAKCMTEQGFEYKMTPKEKLKAMYKNAQTSNASVEMDEKYVKSYGYGMFTNFEGSGGSSNEDPNQSYLESLSEKEQEAYNKALYGDQQAVEPLSSDSEGGEGEGGSGSVSVEPDKNSCTYKAWSTGNKDSEKISKVMDDPEYEDLLGGLSDGYVKSERDKNYKKVFDNWSKCMNDAGYPINKENKIGIDLVSKKSQEKGMMSDSGKPSDKLVDYELKVAMADYKCSKKFSIQKAQLNAQAKFETEYIKENKAKFDALIEKYGEKK